MYITRCFSPPASTCTDRCPGPCSPGGAAARLRPALIGFGAVGLSPLLLPWAAGSPISGAISVISDGLPICPVSHSTCAPVASRSITFCPSQRLTCARLTHMRARVCWWSLSVCIPCAVYVSAPFFTAVGKEIWFGRRFFTVTTVTYRSDLGRAYAIVLSSHR